ncbi:MAG TPA: aldo/keto reductase [Candidatus Methylomirabilis sp.]|nr:aldo/keto reductase [Candidatus Methylomirabilis sp.]
MNRAADVPLVLGGHSFISQLGNDPPASEPEQRAIVAACLDGGIRWIDTTYQPERVALGRVLEALGRRGEATILAWNFFTHFSPGDSVGGPAPYRPGHIDLILEQLRTSFVDCLVLVPLPDVDENRRQEELMREWQRRGYVRSLGLWIEDPALIGRYRAGDPFRLAIRPFNVATGEVAPVFRACKASGWETVATSPFFRGWELDKVLAAAAARGHGEAGALRPVLADLMLRFSLFHAEVDRVIVAMRRVEWIARNLASVSRGRLTDEEHRRLRRLRGLASGRPRWWQRLPWRAR